MEFWLAVITFNILITFFNGVHDFRAMCIIVFSRFQRPVPHERIIHKVIMWQKELILILHPPSSRNDLFEIKLVLLILLQLSVEKIYRWFMKQWWTMVKNHNRTVKLLLRISIRLSHPCKIVSCQRVISIMTDNTKPCHNIDF